MNYEKLFNYMSEQHNVTLLETDMQDICRIVNEIQLESKHQTTYNHTFWQKLTLPLMYCWWRLDKSPTKKTWHEFKKAIEKHTHRYTIDMKDGFYQCEHEGCTVENWYEYLDDDGFYVPAPKK